MIVVDFDKDYYAILGLENKATIDEIKKAYRVLAKKYHPDVNKSHNASEIFNAVTEAYEVLSDQKTREKYDANARASRRDGFREERAREVRRETTGRSRRKARNGPSTSRKGLIFLLSLIAPGLVQIDSGDRKLGGWLLISYFVFWALAMMYGLEIGILALLVWGYAVLDAFVDLRRVDGTEDARA